MIIIDTHIWIWWVHGSEKITKTQAEIIKLNESDVIGVCAISCWEIAKLVEQERIDLYCPLKNWFEQALSYPGIQLFELTPDIAIESTQLPGKFHKDPADQIIVATARVHGCKLVTSDTKIIKYPHINSIE